MKCYYGMTQLWNLFTGGSEMLKEIGIGLIVLLAISYMVASHPILFFILVTVAAILLIAFALGDLLLMEYHNRK